MEREWQVIRRISTGLILASALCLGGCPQEPAPTDEAVADAAEDRVNQPPAVEAEADAGADMQKLLAGTVTARFSGAQETTLVASECTIANGGANGVIRAGDGAFELSWADGAFRLLWTTSSGVFQGNVNGTVQPGGGVTFEGRANGQAAQGFAVCTNF